MGRGDIKTTASLFNFCDTLPITLCFSVTAYHSLEGYASLFYKEQNRWSGILQCSIKWDVLQNLSL